MDSKPVTGEIFKENDFASYPIVFGKKKMFWRILFIERIDKYGGTCENISRKIGINPKICICNHEKDKLEWLENSKN